MQRFELTDLSSPPLADDADATRVLSKASECSSDAPAVLWVVSSGTQALGGVATVRRMIIDEKRRERKRKREIERKCSSLFSLLSEACRTELLFNLN